MKIKSKIFVSFGLLATAITPIALATSCGSSSSGAKYTSTDISGLNDYFNPGVKENNKLISAVNEINKNGTEEEKNLLKQKTVLITTGGQVNDRSFNQSVWEAVSKFSKEASISGNSYQETRIIDDYASSKPAYDYALKNDFKIWILTGYQQESLFVRWLSESGNKDKFINAGIKVLTVDWYSENPIIPKGQLLGLNFKTQESSFVIGYATAKLLSEVYPGVDNENNRLLNTFAGGDFAGATNYNYGFYEGLRQWNKDKTAFNDLKVFSTSMSADNPMTADTAFIPDAEGVRDKVEKNVNTGAKVMMPVAGPLTGTALELIKAKGSDQWLIGVDTDMSQIYDKNYMLTSSEKRIGIAIYKSLISLYGLASKYDDESLKSFLGNGISVDKDGYILNGSEKTNINIIGGYLEGFVGASKSTLNAKYKLADDKTYAARFDEIIAETWNSFFGEDKKTGRFETELKPTSTSLSAFEIKNVKYGTMTANNMSDYFKPAIEEINKR